MSAFFKALVLLVGGFALVAAGSLLYFIGSGMSARPEPGRLETFVALTIRNLAVGRQSRNLKNPIERSAEVIAAGRAHFADHCASCHANDGSGNTEMGKGLYPKAPDMRLPRTQDLTDGQLFYIIENGVRLTGMPAWGTGDAAGEESSWHLVHFIRHLPELSEIEIVEMERLNPVSPDEVLQRIEEERFLAGAPKAPAAPSSPTPGHPGGHK